MNILDCTIKMKKETQAHYERLAEVVTNKELKRLLSLFASVEAGYVEELTMLENDMKSLDVQNLNGMGDNVCVYSPHADLLKVAGTMKDNSDASRYVEQEEKATIKFFDMLGSQEGDEQLRRVYKLIADKERDHLKMQEEVYFFVEEPKSYLEWAEFSNLKSL